VTGEYPPQPGGVSDYTRLVARGLARAGDRVTIWAPPCDVPDESYPGVTVHRLPDRFGPRSLRLIGGEFDRAPSPKRWLVQYVPHAFGWKAANLPLCLWLRSRRRDSLWVMFHEVAYPSGAGYSLAEHALAFVTRTMAAIVGGAAERVFVSIPAWRTLVESLVSPRAPIVWLPVVSSVPVADDPMGTAEVRSRIGDGHPIVGHLGTYGGLIRPLLSACVPALLASTDSRLLLLGRGGESMRDEFALRHPGLAGRIHAPGQLPAEALSRHVTACDVMLQPYPDGVSTRRTTAMVALSHGRPTVTTTGRLTEPLWSESGALVLTPADHAFDLAAVTASLLADPARLLQLAGRARSLYTERFDLAHTIETLRSGS
jgi:glycosyltransferase involved in cell wall biosynthesis